MKHKLGGIVKKILKNNQVIITALVLMIAIVGYLRMTNDNKDSFTTTNITTESMADQTSVETDSGQVLDNELFLDLEDSADVSSTSVTQDPLAVVSEAPKAQDTASDAAVDEFADISAEDIGTDTVDVADANVADSDTTGDAVLVSNTINADFFSTAKIKREQTRAQNKETLMDVVNNANVTESDKQAAINSIIEMTDFAEKESAAEILLEAKGFQDAVISIVDGNADVLINATNLTEQQMAQIEDIVKRKTGLSAENIVITPVGVVE